MSADVLRRAAALMRERLPLLPEPPWNPVELPEHLSAHGPEWVVDSTERLIAGNIGISSDSSARPIAEHIASWHPGVVVLVADWLDDYASWLTVFKDTTRTVDNCPALRLARTYLGES